MCVCLEGDCGTPPMSSKSSMDTVRHDETSLPMVSFENFRECREKKVGQKTCTTSPTHCLPPVCTHTSTATSTLPACDAQHLPAITDRSFGWQCPASLASSTRAPTAAGVDEGAISFDAYVNKHPIVDHTPQTPPSPPCLRSPSSAGLLRSSSSSKITFACLNPGRSSPIDRHRHIYAHPPMHRTAKPTGGM